MSEKQDCPLCNTLAGYELVDHDDKKHFKCPVCTKFLVTIDSEDEITNQSTEWKMNASSTAKNVKIGEIMVITMVDTSILNVGERKYPVLDICNRATFRL